MFTNPRHFPMLAAVGLAVLAAAPAEASGGWMGFRNDTPATLVIQEKTVASRPGRPQKIFANETVRDTPPAGASRSFAIFDSDKPGKPLYTGRFPGPAAGENVLYVIKSDGKGGVTIEVVKSPAAPSVLKKLPGKR
jgi:hypothetical protein